MATLSPASPLAAWFRLARVGTCVDVGMVREQLQGFDEAVAQVVAADALSLTKLDLDDEDRAADPADDAPAPFVDRIVARGATPGEDTSPAAPA